MGMCPVCNMEVADDQMEAHAASHSETAAPAEGGEMTAEAPMAEAPMEMPEEAPAEAPAEGGDEAM